MKKRGEWGGNLELAATARCFNTHITIHNLDAPRMEIKNYADLGGSRTIHLSYHDQEHYSSVRHKTDLGYEATQDIELTAVTPGAAMTARIQPGVDEPRNEAERICQQSTGCTNMKHIRSILRDVANDIDAAVEILIAEETEGIGWDYEDEADGTDTKDSKDAKTTDGDRIEGDGNNYQDAPGSSSSSSSSERPPRNNDPCTCGSGKRYKKCCKNPGRAKSRSRSPAEKRRDKNKSPSSYNNTGDDFDPDRFTGLSNKQRQKLLREERKVQGKNRKGKGNKNKTRGNDSAEISLIQDFGSVTI